MVPQLPATAYILSYLPQIDHNRWYSNFGPLHELFRMRLEDHFGARRGSICLMANATLALTAVFQEAAVRNPGGRCVMPSWTFAASAHAAVLAGLVPHFVDIDPLSGQISPEAVAALSQHKDVAAILVVSEFGRPISIHEWEAMQRQTGVRIIIDAAAAFDSVKPSSIPTVVSLHATKPVGSGEGAFLICDDTQLVENLRRRSNFGFNAKREALTLGMNAKMSEYHAAVGLASLDRWGEVRNDLISIANRYREALLKDEDVIIADDWGETWISSTFNVRLRSPRTSVDFLIKSLNSSGIEARRWWGNGCHAQPAFTSYPREPLPNTEAIAQSTLALPFHPSLSKDDVIRITNEFQSAVRKSPAKRKSQRA
jgi:dTDP-4-amino-4,6-dideoxygalactose transaminase